jgi:hypothetical protein
VSVYFIAKGIFVKYFEAQAAILNME